MPSSPDISRSPAPATSIAKAAGALLSFAATWLCAPAWAAAAPDDGFPPPGFYRIDMDSTLSPAGTPMNVRIEQNGSTGHTVGTWSDGQGNSATRSFDGKGPNTWCLPPRKDAAAAAAAMPGAMACRDQTFRRTDNGAEFSAVCSFGKFTTTVRKLDAVTWEYLTHTTPSSGGAAPSIDGMRALMEYQASHAPTEADRDKAKKALAELPALQAKRDAALAATQAAMEKALKDAPPERAAEIRQQMAALQGGQSMMASVNKQRWTRLADTCPPGGK